MSSVPCDQHPAVRLRVRARARALRAPRRPAGGRLMGDPERQLSPIARRVWRLQQLGAWAVLCVAGVILTLNVDVLGPLFWIVPAIGLVLCTTLVPPLLYSRWRWDVR